MIRDIRKIDFAKNQNLQKLWSRLRRFVEALSSGIISESSWFPDSKIPGNRHTVCATKHDTFKHVSNNFYTSSEQFAALFTDSMLESIEPIVQHEIRKKSAKRPLSELSDDSGSQCTQSDIKSSYPWKITYNNDDLPPIRYPTRTGNIRCMDLVKVN